MWFENLADCDFKRHITLVHQHLSNIYMHTQFKEEKKAKNIKKKKFKYFSECKIKKKKKQQQKGWNNKPAEAPVHVFSLTAIFP